MKLTKQIEPECGKIKTVARKMAKTIAQAALVSCLMLGGPNPVQADSLELMVGQKTATMDLKASAEIANRLGVFLRARPSVDYSRKIDVFGLADLDIKLVGGLDAVGEIQYTSGSIVPRAGVQYFTSKGDISVYTLATIGMDSKSYLESLTALEYDPNLAGSVNLLTRIENVTDLNGNGHVWSTQRTRLGISVSGWGFGAAIDLTEIGDHPKQTDGTFGYNVGGFVRRTF